MTESLPAHLKSPTSSTSTAGRVTLATCYEVVADDQFLVRRHLKGIGRENMIEIQVQPPGGLWIRPLREAGVVYTWRAPPREPSALLVAKQSRRTDRPQVLGSCFWGLGGA